MDAAGLERVDAAVGSGLAMSVKDESEIETIKFAAKLSSDVIHKIFKNRVLDIIDDDNSRVPHTTLSDELDNWFSNTADPKYAKYVTRLKMAPDEVESAYAPIIQSGGSYSLKPSAQSNDDNLTAGIIVASMGARYKSYCTTVSRTLVVGEPTKAMEKNYKFLLDVQAAALAALTPGVEMKAV